MHQPLRIVKQRMTPLVKKIAAEAIGEFAEIPGGAPRSKREMCALLVTAARRRTPISDPMTEHRVLGAECHLASEGMRPTFDKSEGRLLLVVAYASEAGHCNAKELEELVLCYIAHVRGSTDAAQKLHHSSQQSIERIWQTVVERREEIRARGEELYADLEPLLPEGLSLKPHQRDYLALAEERKWRLINADDQGLGKTIEQVVSLAVIGERAFPALIMSPKSVVGAWVYEVERWLEKLNVRVITVREDLTLPTTPEERSLKRDVAAARRRLKDPEKPRLTRDQVGEIVLQIKTKHETAASYTDISVEDSSGIVTIKTKVDKEARRALLGVDEINGVVRRRATDAARLIQQQIRAGRLKKPQAIARAARRLLEGSPARSFASIVVEGRSATAVFDEEKFSAWKARPLVVISGWTEMLHRSDVLSSMRWGTIVGDESQLVMRNPESATTKTFWALRAGVPHRMILTGTLMPNGRPAQAYPAIKAVRPDAVGTFRDYGRRYCDPQPQYLAGREKPITVYKGRSDEVGFAKLLSGLMIRRLKSQLPAGELPDKIRYFSPVPIPEKAKLMLAEIKEEAALRIEDMADRLRDQLLEAGEDPDLIARKVKSLKGASVAAALVAAREATGLLKVRHYLLDFCDEMVTDEDPAVFFFQHYTAFDAAAAALRERHGEEAVLCGSGRITSDAKRRELVERWQSGEGRFLLLTSAFSQGVTLTRARRIVKMERSWEPGQEDQEEDRVFRIGQQRDCYIHYPHIFGSTDDIVSESLKSKERGANHLQGSGQEKLLQEEALKWLES